MSLELCGNLNDELERYALLRRPGMTPQRVAELKPPFDINRFPTVLNAEDIASDGVPLGVVDAVSLAPSDELRLWMERLSRGALPTAPTATAPTATATTATAPTAPTASLAAARRSRVASRARASWTCCWTSKAS